MLIKTIEPIIKPVAVVGRLMYDERARAYALIRFKRRIIDLFPQLRQDKSWCYSLEYWQDKNKTIERIKQAKEGIPLLIFIYPTGGKDEQR